MGCTGDGVGSASVNCTNKPPYGHAPLPKEHWPSQSVHATVHTSSGVNGPWKASHSDLSCNNPAPAVHRNGTVYVVCHGGSLHGHHAGPMQTLYGGPTEHGPWRQVSSMQFSGTTIDGSPQRPNSSSRYSTVWEGVAAICARPSVQQWFRFSELLHGVCDSDPFLWIDPKTGAFHVISHAYPGGSDNVRPHHYGDTVGGHAFSVDGLEWHWSTT